VFASLRLRLTIAYFVVAGVLLAVVAIIGTMFVLSMWARSTNEAISDTIAEAPNIMRLVAGHGKQLRSVAPEIIARLERTNVRIVILDDGGAVGRLSEPPPPPNIAMLTMPNGAIIERRDGAIRTIRAPRRATLPFSTARRDFWRHTLFEVGVSVFGLHPSYVRVAGGVINVFPDLDRFAAVLISAVVTMSAAGLCAAILALLLGRYITDQALRPLVDVTQSLRRFSQGDFSPGSIVTNQRNEIGELAVAFNAAADQVVAAFDERERNEQHMRQFIADAGHELRTPLTVVMGYIDVLRRGAVADRELTTTILDTMGGESRRMRTLIDKLIFLARLDRERASQVVEMIDVAEIATKVVEKFAPLAPNGLRLERDGAAWAVGDPVDIHEAISNIVDNALKYAPNAPIDVRVQHDEGHVEVAIKDRGPGMTSEEQVHAFDRFYRGERRFEIEGSGLGLAIAKSAVERAHGTLRIESEPGSGTEFRIELPTAEPAGV
jgi:two-component system OmpR family sensor kinase